VNFSITHFLTSSCQCVIDIVGIVIHCVTNIVGVIISMLVIFSPAGTIGGDLPTTVAKLSPMFNQVCHVDLYRPWSHQAYQTIALHWLKEPKFEVTNGNTNVVCIWENAAFGQYTVSLQALSQRVLFFMLVYIILLQYECITKQVYYLPNCI